MNHSHKFFRAIGVDPDERGDDRDFAKEADIPVSRLRYYNDQNIFPAGEDLKKICEVADLSPLQLKLRIGHIDKKTLDALTQNSDRIANLLSDGNEINNEEGEEKVPGRPGLVFETDLGKLYKGDCIELLGDMESETVDMVFADPPFNLDKEYPSGIDDNLKDEKYISWCESWLYECARILKHGGSLFVWNIPKWNTYISRYLNDILNFRHWISTDITYTLPIRGRLYPSHYSLLYYCKGEKPKTFDPDRLPLETCRHCHKDIKDYGGYKNKMNPKGKSLTDVWYDIPPVRHSKYKNRSDGNELSLKLLDRIIEMSTDPGDVVFDPFGGAGTTYAVSEIKNRRWIGIEIGPTDVIKERLESTDEERKYLEDIREELNNLFPEDVKRKRKEKGVWTDDTYHSDGDGSNDQGDRESSSKSTRDGQGGQIELNLS